MKEYIRSGDGRCGGPNDDQLHLSTLSIGARISLTVDYQILAVGQSARRTPVRDGSGSVCQERQQPCISLDAVSCVCESKARLFAEIAVGSCSIFLGIAWKSSNRLDVQQPLLAIVFEIE